MAIGATRRMTSIIQIRILMMFFDNEQASPNMAKNFDSGSISSKIRLDPIPRSKAS